MLPKIKADNSTTCLRATRIEEAQCGFYFFNISTKLLIMYVCWWYTNFTSD